MRCGLSIAAVLVSSLFGCGEAFSSAVTDAAAGDDASSGADAASADAAAPDAAGHPDGAAHDGAVDGNAPFDAGLCAVPCPRGFECTGGVCLDSAAAHFSLVSNPSGNWTYGYGTSLGSSLKPYNLTSIIESTLKAWTLSAGSLVPSVFSNTSGMTTVYNSSFTMGPAELGFHPGPSGQRSIVRFTAPVTGLYGIDVRFVGLSGANGAKLSTVDVAVFIKSSVVLGQTINTNGGGNVVTLTQPHNQLLVGDVVDFVVGYGNDNNEANDPTGLRAIMTAE